MSTIKILPSIIIDQIAAGEVIQRPSSVVKNYQKTVLMLKQKILKKKNSYQVWGYAFGHYRTKNMINHLKDIIDSLHYILMGISITFMVQSITMLFEYRIRKIESSSIMKLLFYKWIILTIISAIPYAFNIKVPSIFIILCISILFFFWYKLLEFR